MKPPTPSKRACRACDALADRSSGTLGGFNLVEIDASAEEVNRQFDVLRQNPTVATGSHVFHTAADKVPFVPTGNLFVVFKPNVAEAEQQALLSRHHLQMVEALGKGEFIVKATPASVNPIKGGRHVVDSALRGLRQLYLTR